ncbi:peptidoglycan DD-metalloendopeptidase family protein [Erysipelothrix sp. HDW6B]|uniref:M23 family metallopeptidase n=1 Tax=Erysipelothrix TaxID=1647 RepID=UPI001358020C|nr:MULTISPECIES: M23 family metallopeptidase [Erysipelothrix]QIK85091.1 peptidoglycan DD-metalloendopeptidase family protein [Erysipelothrix sp. HDW6B]
MKKNFIVIGVALGLSVILGLLGKYQSDQQSIEAAMQVIDTSKANFPQEVVAVNDRPVEITKLYHSGKLVGIIRDTSRLDTMFNDVYANEYAEEFPDSKLSFIDDIYQTKELSYNIYEDRDVEIFGYIHEKNLFAIESNKVTFSNGAVIYVKNREDFNTAREMFIKNFVTEAGYEAFVNQKKPVTPDSSGMLEKSLEINETVKIEKGLASKEDILMNEDQVLTFLNYGYEPKLENYTVQKYDTVAGVGSQNGMSASQIVSINSDKISSEQQILQEGMELNVSKFDSPFTVLVTKEMKTTEPIYPEDIEYVEDPTVDEGTEIVDVVAQEGIADVSYNILFVNGEQQRSDETSRKTTTEAVRGKVRIGTKEEPKVSNIGVAGTGRWPLADGRVICEFGCYGGHRGVDMQPWGVYGSIFSIDRGVVNGKGYDQSGWGHWVRINHGNGYQSLYAHMPGPAAVSQGETVAAGQYLGQVGDTGFATTPHLHLEIWDSGGNRLNACNGFVTCR